MEVQIKKLIILLLESGFPKDIQDSWIKVLPQMSLKQIDKFINVLEARYLNKITSNIDKKYKEKIEKILLEFKEKKEKTERDFNDTLKNFSTNLNI
ncbi:hypothetical protein A2531_06650 [Candidatus Falkowbacteria bacterium RIFOXYD2_FULL_34_120]|uniref:Uncharacterized protein n=1 Tax=Candidatus Falkowbacteria bacterium RIFOXYD2_FULL_34_120 TaxID=1798007 RepID=A0A1F5TQM9_9BACT|nr:MAG: hypothetical protein A2531_06650 [Candidatus Falkowbacteria bacterium RIFOXYD2_FULL_34_120]